MQLVKSTNKSLNVNELIDGIYKFCSKRLFKIEFVELASQDDRPCTFDVSKSLIWSVSFLKDTPKERHHSLY